MSKICGLSSLFIKNGGTETIIKLSTIINHYQPLLTIMKPVGQQLYTCSSYAFLLQERLKVNAPSLDPHGMCHNIIWKNGGLMVV